MSITLAGTFNITEFLTGTFVTAVSLKGRVDRYVEVSPGPPFDFSAVANSQNLFYLA